MRERIRDRKNKAPRRRQWVKRMVILAAAAVLAAAGILLASAADGGSETETTDLSGAYAIVNTSTNKAITTRLPQ